MAIYLIHNHKILVCTNDTHTNTYMPTNKTHTHTHTRKTHINTHILALESVCHFKDHDNPKHDTHYYKRVIDYRKIKLLLKDALSLELLRKEKKFTSFSLKSFYLCKDHDNSKYERYYFKRIMTIEN